MNPKQNSDRWERSIQKTKEREASIENEIVKGKNPIETLLEFYNKEMFDLMDQYKRICSLDFELLGEFGIEVSKVISGLKQKIEGLKNTYWKELFDKLEVITSKLCTRQKETFLRKLNDNVNIDFTEDNIYSIVVWACKNANEYFNVQILDLFDDLSGDTEAIKLYKSNQKIFNKDDYRYKKPDFTHYTLDYRMVLRMHNLKYAENILNDIRTVAKNLGFETHGFYKPQRYSQDITLKSTEYGNKALVEYKFFQNGNLHLRFNMEFLKCFNIEVSRLKKWVHNKEEVMREFDDGIKPSEEEFDKFFNSLNQISVSDVKLLK